MESKSHKLKWLCFSGFSEEYPIWSTSLQVFAQTNGLSDTIAGDDLPLKPPGQLGKDPSNEEHAAHVAAEAAYRRALHDTEKQKNNLCCNMAMVLDSTNPMLIRYDCADNKGLGDECKAWVLLQQMFRSDEIVTVVTGSFFELRTRLMNYEESRSHRESGWCWLTCGNDVQGSQTKAQVLK